MHKNITFKTSLNLKIADLTDRLNGCLLSRGFSLENKLTILFCERKITFVKQTSRCAYAFKIIILPNVCNVLRYLIAASNPFLFSYRENIRFSVSILPFLPVAYVYFSFSSMLIFSFRLLASRCCMENAITRIIYSSVNSS